MWSTTSSPCTASCFVPWAEGSALAPSVHDDPLAAFKAARADVEAVLVDPELAGAGCETPNGPMRVEQQIDEVVSDDMPLHGWDLLGPPGRTTRSSRTTSNGRGRSPPPSLPR